MSKVKRGQFNYREKKKRRKKEKRIYPHPLISGGKHHLRCVIGIRKNQFRNPLILAGKKRERGKKIASPINVSKIVKYSCDIVESVEYSF